MSPSLRGWSGLPLIVRRLELGGWHVAQGFEESAVVEPAHPAEGCELHSGVANGQVLRSVVAVMHEVTAARPSVERLLEGVESQTGPERDRDTRQPTREREKTSTTNATRSLPRSRRT